jgi:LysM repeat protein
MQGRRRSPARLIAPVALLLAVAAVLLVIQGSLGSDDSDGGGRSNGQQAEQTTPTETRERPVRQRASYTVKLNDTLGLISEKTGVSVERLQELNPELDPQNLIVGQKIKLRE